MLIDWFTVGAQVVNFVVLMVLLRHFLYKPILKAIDDREAFISAELADANTKKAEAKKDMEAFNGKAKAFDEARAELLRKAVDEAKNERERLIADGRAAVALSRAAQEKALQNDFETLGDEIGRQASEEVMGIARRALMDLATVSLEERMGEVFMRRLRQMEGKQKEALAAAIKASHCPMVVHSAFEMPAEQRAAIQNALNETFSAEVPVRFETSTGILCGIELAADGQKVGWSIADYLGSLDRRVEALIAAQPDIGTTALPETPTDGAVEHGTLAAAV